MNRFSAFFKYNNAVPVVLGALFLATGGVFAASPDARDAVLSTSEVVRSVDNSYIASVNLDSFVPRIQITGVTEDSEYYYVAYTLTTIDLADFVWRDVDKSETMKVSKADLADRDLGLYVTKQLKEIVDWQLARLRETQNFEKKVGITPKVVATEYGGLIGKLLDPTEEALPGYAPVKPPEPERPVVTGADVAAIAVQEMAAVQAANEQAAQSSVSADTAAAPAAAAPTTASTESGSTTPPVVSDVEPPTITVLGNNPATVDVGTAYSDLGAAVTDNVNGNLGVTSSGTVDTSVAGEYVITYTATDQAGNIATSTRTIIVSALSSNAEVSSTTPVEASPSGTDATSIE